MPNTLILYDGKMSSTERVAEGLGQVIGHVRICEISEGPERLDSYEGVCFVFNFYGALTAGKTKVYLEERREILREKRLAFLGIGFTDNGFTKYCVDMEDLIGGVSITAMFIRNERQTAEAAFQIARRMQSPLIGCDEISLMEKIETFIVSHRTLGLAVSSDGFVRMTPLDYLYIDGEFYIITEGGLKFRGLLLSESVSCAIYEAAENPWKSESLQMQAKAAILERNSEKYWEILAMKGMTREKLSALPITLFVVKITPQQYSFLSPSFKKAGMDVCQMLDTTFRRRRWEAGQARAAREEAEGCDVFEAEAKKDKAVPEQPETNDDKETVIRERLARAAKEADTAMSAAIINRRESDAAANNAREDMENRIESLVSLETTARLAHEASMMVQEKKTLAETEEELARAALEIVKEKALAPEEDLETEEEAPLVETDPVKEQKDREKLAALIAEASETRGEEDDEDLVVDAFFEPAGDVPEDGENEDPAGADAESSIAAKVQEKGDAPADDRKRADGTGAEAESDGEEEEREAQADEKEPNAPVLAGSELRTSQVNSFKMPAFLKSFTEPPRVELPETKEETAGIESTEAERAADEAAGEVEAVSDTPIEEAEEAEELAEEAGKALEEMPEAADEEPEEVSDMLMEEADEAEALAEEPVEAVEEVSEAAAKEPAEASETPVEEADEAEKLAEEADEATDEMTEAADEEPEEVSDISVEEPEEASDMPLEEAEEAEELAELPNEAAEEVSEAAEEPEEMDIAELLKLMDDDYESDEDELLKEEDVPARRTRSDRNKEKKESFFGGLLSRGKDLLKSLTDSFDDEDDEDDDIVDGMIGDEDDDIVDGMIGDEDDDVVDGMIGDDDDDIVSGVIDDDEEPASEAEALPEIREMAAPEDEESFDDAQTKEPALKPKDLGKDFGTLLKGGSKKMGAFLQNLMDDGEDDDDFFDLDEEEENDAEALRIDRGEEEEHEDEIFKIDEKEERKSIFSSFRRRSKEEYDPDFEAIMDAKEELLPDDESGPGFFGRTLGRMSRFLGFDESDIDEDDEFYDEDDED